MILLSLYVSKPRCTRQRTRRRTMKVWRAHWAYLNTCRLSGGDITDHESMEEAI